MGRPGVTYDDVAQAAHSLQAADQSPTVQRLRDVLGRGSHSTIAAHLRRFHAEQSEPKPPAAPPTWQRACEQLWQQALELAAAEFDDVREALQQRVDEVLADREDLLRRHQWIRASVAQREHERQQAQRALEATQQALLAHQQQVQALSLELEHTQYQLHQAQQQAAAQELAHRQELQQQQAAAATLASVLQDQLRDERERSEQRQQEALLDIDRLRTALTRAQGDQRRESEAHQEARRQWAQERNALQQQRLVTESRLRMEAHQQQQLQRERDHVSSALENARRLIAQLRHRLDRRSGAATATGGNFSHRGTAGGVDRH